jgi:hypothetical protein
MQFAMVQTIRQDFKRGKRGRRYQRLVLKHYLLTNALWAVSSAEYPYVPVKS